MWFEDTSVAQSDLNRIAIPTLIIRGDRDLIKLEHTIQMYQALKKGQLCIYPNAGHNIPSEQAETFAKLAIAFFEGK